MNEPPLARLAILIDGENFPAACWPAARDPVVAVPPGDNTWSDELLSVLTDCEADEDGWVTVGDLGSAIKEAGLTLPKGKLSDLVKTVQAVEVKGSKGKVQVRRRDFADRWGDDIPF